KGKTMNTRRSRPNNTSSISNQTRWSFVLVCGWLATACTQKQTSTTGPELGHVAAAITTDCTVAVNAALNAGAIYAIDCQRRGDNNSGVDDLTTRCSNFSPSFRIPQACCTGHHPPLPLLPDGTDTPDSEGIYSCRNPNAEVLTTPRNFRLNKTGATCTMNP